MSNPFHAAYFADRAVQRTVETVENLRIARGVYRLRFECPEMARRILPGQFLMMRLLGSDDPLLGRPLALYDTVVSSSGEPLGINMVYLVKGKMTAVWRHAALPSGLKSGARWATASRREPAEHW